MRKTPASDHQTALRSPKPATLSTADVGYRSETNLKTLAGADIAALMAGNGVGERDGRFTDTPLPCRRRRAAVGPSFGNPRHNKRRDRFTLRSRRNIATPWKRPSQVRNIEKGAARRGSQHGRVMLWTSRSGQKKSLPFAVDRENAVKTRNGAASVGTVPVSRSWPELSISRPRPSVQSRVTRQLSRAACLVDRVARKPATQPRRPASTNLAYRLQGKRRSFPVVIVPDSTAAGEVLGPHVQGDTEGAF